MTGQAIGLDDGLAWSGYAQFGTHQGLVAKGIGILAGAHRYPEIFEFKDAVEAHLGDRDLALFRCSMHVHGRGQVEVIGCLTPHRDAFGRPGFAGSAVVVDDDLEMMHHALTSARQLLDDLIDRGLPTVLATHQSDGSGAATVRIERLRGPQDMAFHLDQDWEQCEQSQLASLLKHCCQHPELDGRTLLILDRPSPDSHPFDWRFFEAIRRTLSERLMEYRESGAVIARLKEELRDEVARTRQAQEELASEVIRTRQAQEELTREVARTRQAEEALSERDIDIRHLEHALRLERARPTAHRSADSSGSPAAGQRVEPHRRRGRRRRAWRRSIPVLAGPVAAGVLLLLVVLVLVAWVFGDEDETAAEAAPAVVSENPEPAESLESWPDDEKSNEYDTGNP